MRGHVCLVFLAAIAACSPEIATGTYLCGPEQLCPEGQACNGPDNTCVVASDVLPFACNTPDPAGDDDPVQGRLIDGLACVSPPNEARGCLLDGDPSDWFQFDVPENCAAVQIEARLTYPIAFEPLALQIASDGGAPAPAETPCSPSTVADEGEEIRCFELDVANGTHHALGVVHTGSADCDGACAHNRYTFTLRLATP